MTAYPPFPLRLRAVCTLAVLVLAVPFRGETGSVKLPPPTDPFAPAADNQSQIDRADAILEPAGTTPAPDHIPGKLAVRVRLTHAAVAPAQIKVTGVADVAMGQWTPWKLLEEMPGKNPACVTAAFEGCKDFTAEFQLGFGGAILKTVTETGTDCFGAMIVPRDLIDQGADPRSPEFLNRCLSVTEQARRVRDQWAAFFKDKGPVPERYLFETFNHGLNLGWYYATGQLGIPGDTLARTHSSLDATRYAAEALRLIGYNAFVFEKNLLRAEKVGLRDQFLKRLTFHVYRPPWYPSPCPSAPDVATKQAAVLADMATRMAPFKDVHELALVWGDEVGVAAKNDHIVGCPACAASYRTYLKDLGLQPGLFGKASWDDILPYAGDTSTPETAAAAYYTFRFWTYATARCYEPAAKQFKERGVHVYPLMGSVPTANGHSMDFFEFYAQAPSLDIGWETSNRDPRAWQWDDYMADITRSIRGPSDRMELVYVKPHRGATLQRLLGIASRGVTRFDWYDDETGLRSPNGQSEKGDRNLRNQGLAARVLGAVESVTYAAQRVPERAEVALVSPRTTFINSQANRALFQDAKWVWSALRHDGVVVDILDETMLEQGALAGRKVLYLVGTGLRQKSFEVVLDWVKQGGILWTDIGGPASNEFRQAIASVAELTGQNVASPEIWGTDPGYGATRLEPFQGLNKGEVYTAPSNAVITLSAAFGGGPITAAVGRVTLNPQKAETLGTFPDGRPAVIRRAVGKGTAYVVGTYAGLAYSERVRCNDFNMSTDYDAAARRLVTCAALASGVMRPAVSSEPLVETVLVRNGAAHALYLMNWMYAATTNGYTNLPAVALRIELPGLTNLREAVSAVGNRPQLSAGNRGATLTIDRLAEGDVIVLR